MSDFSTNGQDGHASQAAGRPLRLYLWVVCAIFLLQGVLLLSSIYRSFIYMSDKLEASLPSEYWSATIDVRASAWLVIVPFIAAIIVDWRSPLWRTAILHLGLLSFAVFFSGNYLHRYAHIQSDQLTQLIKLKEASQTSNSMSSLPGSSSQLQPELATSESYANKSYEGVNFHKSYGFGYWLGELTLIGTAYLMKCAIGYAVLYFRMTEYRTRQAQQLRNTLTQLQHDSLCNRLRPHFLFNTLNTISSLTLTDGKAARICISQLGELLRESIESLPEGEIRLDKEIEILEMYLKIQKTRFGDKLDYSIDIEEGLAGALVPAFVLQPLVENSFKHGFRVREKIAKVGVSAKREGKYCRLEIFDNGAQINPAQPLDEKYGLGLTRQRLKLQYDQEAEISYEPNMPSGLRVIVLVPFHLQNGEVE